MKVDFFHTKECHIWKTALSVLEDALADAGVEQNYCVSVITSDEEAEEFKFTGSPTILVNGANVDPMRRKVTKFVALGCAPYFWNQKTFEYPPKEMILQALSESKQ
ncbi:MAG: hypothetical protein ACE5DI_04400 [Candidatus Micrarchaeia archaeon]